MRPIDADALKAVLAFPKESKEMGELLTIIIHQTIDEQPTADVRPNVRGEWIPFDVPWYKCSECGAVRENKSFMENFCPNCGADMRGDTE